MSSLFLYDEIGDLGCSASAFTADLAGITGDVSVRINSPGGEVSAGLVMYHSLRAHRGRVTVQIDGIAASVATVIAMAASPGQLLIQKRATMIVHSAWAITSGDASEHRRMADLLDRASANIAGIYAERTGQPASSWLAMMNAETWFVGAEAVTASLADAVLALPVAA